MKNSLFSNQNSRRTIIYKRTNVLVTPNLSPRQNVFTTLKVTLSDVWVKTMIIRPLADCGDIDTPSEGLLDPCGGCFSVLSPGLPVATSDFCLLKSDQMQYTDSSADILLQGWYGGICSENRAWMRVASLITCHPSRTYRILLEPVKNN